MDSNMDEEVKKIIEELGKDKEEMSEKEEVELKDWRVQVKVSKEFYKKFDEYCQRFRFTKSQMGNLCLHAGFNAIVRAINPEELLTAEQLLLLAKSMSEYPDKDGLLGIGKKYVR